VRRAAGGGGGVGGSSTARQGGRRCQNGRKPTLACTKKYDDHTIFDLSRTNCSDLVIFPVITVSVSRSD
jgi:hypothetical protein